MATNIAKVDANSNLHPGVSARNSCNEVLRWFFLEKSVLLLEDFAHSISRHESAKFHCARFPSLCREERLEQIQ
jgi:hypothetical protein